MVPIEFNNLEEENDILFGYKRVLFASINNLNTKMAY